MDSDKGVWMPSEADRVRNWDDVEKLYHHTFYNELRICPEEIPLIITEPPVNHPSNREKLTQIMFETFCTPALYISTSASLALFASGRTTGLVLDSGSAFTYSVPVYEGHALNYATIRLEVAGNFLTDYLMELVRDRGGSFKPTTTAEREIVRDMKEKHGAVAVDFDMEVRKADTHPVSYELPDGQSISIGSERLKCPEALFQPKLLGVERSGVHVAIVDAINRSDKDLRNSFYNNIVLFGGSTLFPGLSQRLFKEVRDIAQGSPHVEVHAPEERKYSAWIGASILSSLSTFSKMVLTLQEYDEYGPTIVHQKCF